MGLQLHFVKQKQKTTLDDVTSGYIEFRLMTSFLVGSNSHSKKWDPVLQGLKSPGFKVQLVGTCFAVPRNCATDVKEYRMTCSCLVTKIT